MEESAPSTDTAAEASGNNIEGFSTIDALVKSLVASFKSENLEEYRSHVMTRELEEKQALTIENDSIRQVFIHEFGFSINHEDEYFREIIAYFKQNNIDLEKVAFEEIEYQEYNSGNFEPVMIYEVFIPIKMDYEALIDITVIKIEDKYYLTSELGV